MRAALGLKPLKAESNNVKKEQEAGQVKRDEAEKAVKDAELKDRVQRSALRPNTFTQPFPDPHHHQFAFFLQHTFLCSEFAHQNSD